MKVEVVELRQTGQKRTVTKETPRVVGYLDVFTYTNTWHSKSMLIATLLRAPLAGSGYVLEDLEEARLGKIKGDWFLIHGVQHQRRGKKVFASYPQTWLCRPIQQAV